MIMIIVLIIILMLLVLRITIIHPDGRHAHGRLPVPQRADRLGQSFYVIYEYDRLQYYTIA